jgi:hypothetical protein
MNTAQADTGRQKVRDHTPRVGSLEKTLTSQEIEKCANAVMNTLIQTLTRIFGSSNFFSRWYTVC